MDFSKLTVCTIAALITTSTALADAWKAPKKLLMQETLISEPKEVTLSYVDLTKTRPINCSYPSGSNQVAVIDGEPTPTLTAFAQVNKLSRRISVDGSCGGIQNVHLVQFKYKTSSYDIILEIDESGEVRLFENKPNDHDLKAFGKVIEYYP